MINTEITTEKVIDILAKEGVVLTKDDAILVQDFMQLLADIFFSNDQAL